MFILKVFCVEKRFRSVLARSFHLQSLGVVPKTNERVPDGYLPLILR